jgi:hypothetical protein
VSRDSLTFLILLKYSKKQEVPGVSANKMAYMGA